MIHSTLSLAEASEILQKHNLLREMIQQQTSVSEEEVKKDTTHCKTEIWSLDANAFTKVDLHKPFAHATYDTRDIKPGTLLFIKGNFKSEYLLDADSKGLAAYVAEQSYADYTSAIGLIVTDARKAMSVLAAAFFGNPQQKLTIVGITGTKGKTTTAYFTHAILSAYSNGKAALFSSVDNCVDGKNYVESNLTTPESFDAFCMMREAVDSGMKYLVMEVSSQAYKVNRVYGLKFDVAAFLNISPDHISPIEHPTFEDYLYCKRQIIANTKRLVLNADTDHVDLLLQDAKRNNVHVTTISRIKKEDIEDVDETCEETERTCENYPKLLTPDYLAVPSEDSEAHCIAVIDSNDEDCCEEHEKEAQYSMIDTFSLSIAGDFNYENALAAIAIAGELGVNQDTDLQALHAIDEKEAQYSMIDTFSLSIAGDFNYENALAAIAIAGELGVNQDTDLQALHAIEKVEISGRMEVFEDTHSNTIAVVDYAHNYISTKSVIDFVEERYGKENPRITLVTGSTGDKAVDRRKEIVEAAQNRIEQFIFTTEDTDTEDVMHICEDMQSYVTNTNVSSRIIIDRAEAIEYAYKDAIKNTQEEGRLNVLLAIGKGDERWIKSKRKHLPYEGDSFIVKRLFGL